jgi:hypothetical protein
MPLGAAKTALMGAAGAGGDEDYWVPLLTSTLGSDASTFEVTSAGSSEAWSGFRDIVIHARLKNAGDWQTQCYYKVNDTYNNFEWTAFNEGGSGNINRYNQSGFFRAPTGGLPGVNASFFEDQWQSCIVRLNAINDYSALSTHCNVQIESYYQDLANANAHQHIMGENSVMGTTAITSFAFFGGGSFNLEAGCKAQVYGIKGAD